MDGTRLQKGAHGQPEPPERPSARRRPPVVTTLACQPHDAASAHERQLDTRTRADSLRAGPASQLSAVGAVSAGFGVLCRDEGPADRHRIITLDEPKFFLV